MKMATAALAAAPRMGAAWVALGQALRPGDGATRRSALTSRPSAWTAWTHWRGWAWVS